MHNDDCVIGSCIQNVPSKHDVLLPNALYKLTLHIFNFYKTILQLLSKQATVYSYLPGVKLLS